MDLTVDNINHTCRCSKKIILRMYKRVTPSTKLVLCCMCLDSDVVARIATVIELALASLRAASALLQAISELRGHPHGNFALKAIVYSCIKSKVLTGAVFLANIQCILMCLI